MNEKKTKKSLAVLLSILLVCALVIVVGVFALREMGVFSKMSLQGAMTDGYHTNEEGLNYITLSEAKSMVTEHKLTVENAKDYIGAFMETYEFTEEDENGNEKTVFEEMATIGIKAPYKSSWDDVTINLKNTVTGFTFDFSWNTWGEHVEYIDGKYIVTSYDENDNNVEMEFDLDNYECTGVTGSVYEYDFDPEILYVSESDDEDNEFLVKLSEYEGTYNERNLVVLIQMDEDSDDLAHVGYYSVGSLTK